MHDNLLTEEQARRKWCPSARVAIRVTPSPKDALDDAVVVVANRDADGFRPDKPMAAARCIVGHCMAWKWYDGLQESGERSTKGLSRRGYCRQHG